MVFRESLVASGEKEPVDFAEGNGAEAGREDRGARIEAREARVRRSASVLLTRSAFVSTMMSARLELIAAGIPLPQGVPDVGRGRARRRA